MRTLLVTGPGGAGTSTVAAATALTAQDAGHRVALLSTAAPAVPGLPVTVVDGQRALAEAWSSHAGELAALAPLLTLPPATSVVAVPGVSEVAVLVALGRVAAAGETDLVVLDVGPLPAALGLLALPETVRWWLAQAAPPRLRVLAQVRTTVARGRPGALEAALAAVGALEELLHLLPTGSDVHLVHAPEPGAAGTVRRAATALGLLGHPVASVTLSRVLPAGTGEWSARRAAQTDDVRAALADTGLPLREVAEAALAPRDGTALRALQAGVDTTPSAPLPASGPVPDDTDWLLALPLPFAEKGAVSLTRWEDDLVVDAGGVRRSIPLDSLLRRCTVVSGRVTDPGTPGAALTVRFTPDPAQWPTALLTRRGRG
ncbi:hypothetical protein ASG36_01605 [Geodermatophilus sp. Leaf369]|uniref:ArsA family ATPase n=1 Tax=Geodermatophilus sp. Leaf369 TaxID=1736354 RepID=UPI0006FC7255|nr:ArsA-related P-loop ATPase [Geodermatophilus sp. Leaf369]KQS59772.1 hypothetical protein ASG36_01605 [Geodermatophilus sp. Leaf369]